MLSTTFIATVFRPWMENKTNSEIDGALPSISFWIFNASCAVIEMFRLSSLSWISSTDNPEKSTISFVKLTILKLFHVAEANGNELDRTVNLVFNEFDILF